MTTTNNPSGSRLTSLDILRGADLFLLTIIGPIIHKLWGYGGTPFLDQFTHCQWEGFVLWDLIMPLFIFMSGVTIPFSMAKYKRGDLPKSKALIRIARRVILFWILGMICQGNLLKFQWNTTYFYCNTLHSIAIGYAACALMFLYVKKPLTHILIGVSLLIAYWAAVMFIGIDGYGKGNMTPTGNLCYWIDTNVFGIHRNPKSQYTWILSSLTFIVSAIMGMLSGELLKSGRNHKSAILLASGILCVAAGWLWGLELPVIKKIWTSSMTLVAGGWSLILLAGSYALFDESAYREGFRKAFGWLKVFGMNAILSYLILEIGALCHIGTWWTVTAEIVILTIFYKLKIFLKI